MSKSSVAFEWGLPKNSHKAKHYPLTRASRQQLERETKDLERMTAILERFLTPGGESV